MRSLICIEQHTKVGIRLLSSGTVLLLMFPAAAIVTPRVIFGAVFLLAWLDSWLPRGLCWWWRVLRVWQWLDRVAGRLGLWWWKWMVVLLGCVGCWPEVGDRGNG